jgi:hypothetical protein
VRENGSISGRQKHFEGRSFFTPEKIHSAPRGYGCRRVVVKFRAILTMCLSGWNIGGHRITKKRQRQQFPRRFKGASRDARGCGFAVKFNFGSAAGPT